jgi:parallel beta-helix repeat protein
MKLATLIFLQILFFGAQALAQLGGPLSPPAGAPTQTYRSLDQIEPRTPLIEGAPGVSISSTGTITISEPGSYFLTADVVISDADSSGIRIQGGFLSLVDRGVTLDLNGFSITGPSSATNSGIFSVQSGSNLVVKNGTIRGFENQISLDFVVNVRIEGVTFENSGGTAISFEKVSASTIKNCVFNNSGEDAIYIGNDSANIRVTQCQINRASRFGILIDSSSAVTVESCTVSESESSGIRISSTASGDALGNLVTNSNIYGSGFSGIYVRSDGGVVRGNTIKNCVISRSQDYGIFILGNAGINEGNRIINNDISIVEADSGTPSGIFVNVGTENRIERNQISSITGTGIVTGASSGGNLIINNSVHDVTTGYALDSDDTFGPIISESGALTTTNPWANFEL